MKNLRTMLFLNGTLAFLLGCAALFAPNATQSFLGGGSVTLFQVFGVILLFHGSHMLWVSRRDAPSRGEIRYFTLSDWIWGGTTMFLVGFGSVIQTSAGVIASIALGAVVVIFALAETQILRSALVTKERKRITRKMEAIRQTQRMQAVK